jgi:hypothetical protein
MERGIEYLSAFPMVLTFYLIFFQTQNLWKTKRYLVYILIAIGFATIWSLLPLQSLNKKLLVAPFFWAFTCLICQYIHNIFSPQEFRDKPIVFVHWEKVIGKEIYDKKIGRKPTKLDSVCSVIVFIGTLALLFFLSPYLIQCFKGNDSISFHLYQKGGHVV